MANNNALKKNQSNVKLAIPKEDVTFTTIARNFNPQSLKDDSKIIKLNKTLRPCILIKNKNGEENIFELTTKMFIGSDQARCHVLIEQANVPGLMIVIGFREGKILVKHPGPHTINYKGYDLLPNKTYDVPMDAVFSCGDFEFVIMSAAPENFPSNVKSQKTSSHDKNYYEVEIPEEEKKSSILFYLFHPLKLLKYLVNKNVQGKIDSNDHNEDIDVQDANAKIIPITKKSNKIKKSKEENLEVAELGKDINIFEVYGNDVREIVVNYTLEKREKLKKSFKFFGPIVKIFISVLNDLSYFEKDTLKNLDKKINSLESLTINLRIKNLKKLEGIKNSQATDLVRRGVKSIGDLERRTVYDISRLLKFSVEDASAFKNELKEKIKNGEYNRVNSEIEIVAHELDKLKELKNKFTLEAYEKSFDEEVPPGLFKSVLGFFTRFAIIYKMGPHFGAIAENYDFLSKIYFTVYRWFEHFIRDRAITFQFLFTSGDDVKSEITQLASLLAGGFCFDLLCHLLLGVSLGEYILGLDQKGDHFRKRVKGVCRCLLSYLTFPIIFLSAFSKGFAEMLCKFKTHRTYRPFSAEVITSVICIGISLNLLFPSGINLPSSFPEKIAEGKISNEENKKEKVLKIDTRLEDPESEIVTEEVPVKKEIIVRPLETLNAETVKPTQTHIVDNKAEMPKLPIMLESLETERKLKIVLANEKIAFYKSLAIGIVTDLKGPILRKTLEKEGAEREESKIAKNSIIFHNDQLSAGNGASVKIKLYNGKIVELKQKTEVIFYSFSPNVKKDIGIIIEFGKILFETDDAQIEMITKENNFQPKLFLTSELAAVSPNSSKGQMVYRKSLSLTTVAIFKGEANFYPIDFNDSNSTYFLTHLSNGPRSIKVTSQQFSLLYNNTWRPSVPVSLKNERNKDSSKLFDKFHSFSPGGEYNPISGLYYNSKNDYFDVFLNLRTETSKKGKSVLDNSEKTIFKRIDVIGRIEDRKFLR